MDRNLYLGIDTSCYTTSVALLDEEGALVGEARRILDVRPGRCGLQQSEMVFQHTRNLPNLVEDAFSQVQGCYVLASVGVSGYPRPLEGSYMPAFLAGMSVARSLSTVTGARLHVISHQENHLEAGIWSAKGPEAERFLLLHASGGTTDMLLAEKQEDGRYALTQVGGSMDLHAGQFVDRVGVALGLQFPTGPVLEALAATAEERVELPVSVRKLDVSLSGPATAALRKLEAGCDAASLALGVEYALAETFARMLRNGAKQYAVQDVLLVGGVASNSYIRRHVEEKLGKHRVRLWVPEGRFSCDNATGCAAFAWRMAVSGK